MEAGMPRSARCFREGRCLGAGFHGLVKGCRYESGGEPAGWRPPTLSRGGGWGLPRFSERLVVPARLTVGIQCS